MKQIRTIEIFEYLRHRLTQQSLDFIAILLSPFHALNVEAFVNELVEIKPNVHGEIIVIPHLKHGIMVKNFNFLFKDHPNINFIVVQPHKFEKQDEKLLHNIIKNAQNSLLEIKKNVCYPLKFIYFLSPLSYLSALNLCVGLFDVRFWKLYQPIFIAYDEGIGTYISSEEVQKECLKKDLQDNQYKGLFTFWQLLNSIFPYLSSQIQELNQQNFFHIKKRYLLNNEYAKFRLNYHIVNSFRKVLQKRAKKIPLNLIPVDVLLATSDLEEYHIISSLKVKEFICKVLSFFLEKGLTVAIKPHPAEKLLEKYYSLLKNFPKEKVLLFSPTLITEDILFQLPVKYVVSLCSTVLLTASICDVTPIVIHPDLIDCDIDYYDVWKEYKKVLQTTVKGELNKEGNNLKIFSWEKDIQESSYQAYMPKSVLSHYESATERRFKANDQDVKRLQEKWSGKIKSDITINYPKISAIILNYNNSQDTIKCLESIYKNIKYKRIQVIVIDNGSKTEDVLILKKWFNSQDVESIFCHKGHFSYNNKPFKRELIFIENKENLGFAGGNNIGIKYALNCGADYVWLLNNDTIIDKDALIELIKLAEIDKKIGMVSSKLYCYNDPKKVQYNGEKVVYEGMEDVKGELPKPTNSATGCSLLMRRKFIENVGLLDEDYFLYFEDNDITTRALKAGWKVYYSPYSKIYHKGGASVGGWLKTPLSVYYATRNLLLYHHKHDSLKLSLIHI